MKTISIFLFAFLGIFALPSYGATLSATNDAEFKLNQSNAGAMQSTLLGTAIQKMRMHSLKCVYDYSLRGGGPGSINLKTVTGSNCVIPNKGIIRDVLIDVVTAPTSGGSTAIAVSSGQVTADLLVAASYSGFTGLMPGVPVGTAATAIKMTADRSPVIVLGQNGGVALTAGKLNVHIQYQISE